MGPSPWLEEHVGVFGLLEEPLDEPLDIWGS